MTHKLTPEAETSFKTSLRTSSRASFRTSSSTWIDLGSETGGGGRAGSGRKITVRGSRRLVPSCASRTQRFWKWCFFSAFLFLPVFSLSSLVCSFSSACIRRAFLPSFPAAAALFGALKLQECSSRMCVIITVRRSLQKNPLPVVASCFGCCFPFF